MTPMLPDLRRHAPLWLDALNNHLWIGAASPTLRVHGPLIDVEPSRGKHRQ